MYRVVTLVASIMACLEFLGPPSSYRSPIRSPIIDLLPGFLERAPAEIEAYRAPGMRPWGIYRQGMPPYSR